MVENHWHKGLHYIDIVWLDSSSRFSFASDDWVDSLQTDYEAVETKKWHSWDAEKVGPCI